MPQRIQLRRTRGWRKPAGAVVVARPSKWGNPFAISAAVSREESIRRFRNYLAADAALQDAVRRELRGRDLACWCPLTDADGSVVPCHADVLLALANETCSEDEQTRWEP